jgi:hypothetical protein
MADDDEDLNSTFSQLAASRSQRAAHRPHIGEQPMSKAREPDDAPSASLEQLLSPFTSQNVSMSDLKAAVADAVKERMATHRPATRGARRSRRTRGSSAPPSASVPPTMATVADDSGDDVSGDRSHGNNEGENSACLPHVERTSPLQPRCEGVAHDVAFPEDDVREGVENEPLSATCQRNQLAGLSIRVGDRKSEGVVACADKSHAAHSNGAASSSASADDVSADDPRLAPILRLLGVSRWPLHAGVPAASGSLSFPQAGASSHGQPNAKWATIADSSRPSDVTALLTRTWELRWPDVVISVTGSANALPGLNASEREAFQRGLLGAVRTTKAWIVTGGTDCGVMQCDSASPSPPHPLVLTLTLTHTLTLTLTPSPSRLHPHPRPLSTDCGVMRRPNIFLARAHISLRLPRSGWSARRWRISLQRSAPCASASRRGASSSIARASSAT